MRGSDDAGERVPDAGLGAAGAAPPVEGEPALPGEGGSGSGPPGGSALRIGVATVIIATVVTLFLGYLEKAPCLSDFNSRRYGTLPCYTDIVPLWFTEHLDQGKFPYLQADNEYPVLTGLTMALAAWPASEAVGFFHATAILLGASAIGTALILRRMVGARALYFALAPTLLVYGFVNWDLLPVLLATLAAFAYVRRRDGPSGAFLGLGAAAKLYPGFLTVPFAAGRIREGDRVGAARVAVTAIMVWAVVNAPFALAVPDRWWTFFRFNSQRGADWDSLWFLASRHLGITWTTSLLNLLSLGAFVALAAVLWILKSAREPGFPVWSFGFPLLVAFLLTNKVYSPQYSLWLLPWFALTLPDLRLFAAFELADVGVFITRFRWFATLDPSFPGGLPFSAFETALLIRTVVLVVCLVVWVRRSTDRTAEILTREEVLTG